jgi:hypothetical protein
VDDVGGPDGGRLPVDVGDPGMQARILEEAFVDEPPPSTSLSSVDGVALDRDPLPIGERPGIGDLADLQPGGGAEERARRLVAAAALGGR